MPGAGAGAGAEKQFYSEPEPEPEPDCFPGAGAGAGADQKGHGSASLVLMFDYKNRANKFSGCRNVADTSVRILPSVNTRLRCKTSKTPYVAIDERGLVRSIHLFLFSCVH